LLLEEERNQGCVLGGPHLEVASPARIDLDAKVLSAAQGSMLPCPYDWRWPSAEVSRSGGYVSVVAQF
jgi:hypothetical protein